MSTLTAEEIVAIRSKWPKCETRPQDVHCSFLMEQREINFQPRYEEENPRKNEIENWKPPFLKDSVDSVEILMQQITSSKAKKVFVQTEDRLKWVCQLLRKSKEIALDIKWDEENSFLYSMSLLTIAIPTHTFVFDPYPLRLQIIEYLKPIFEDTTIIKLFHDHQNHILKLQACFHIYPAGIIDTQVVHSFIYKSKFPVSFTYAVFYYLGEAFASTINKEFKWADCRARLQPPSEEIFLPPKLEKFCCINAQLLLRVWCFQKQGIESYAKLTKINPDEVVRTIYDSSKETLLAVFTNKDFQKYVSSKYDIQSCDFINYGLESFEQQQCYVKLHEWRMEQAKVCDATPFQIITNVDMALIAKHDPRSTQELLSKLDQGDGVMQLIAEQVKSILPKNQQPVIFTISSNQNVVSSTLARKTCLMSTSVNMESSKSLEKSFVHVPSNCKPRKPPSIENTYASSVPLNKTVTRPSAPAQNQPPRPSKPSSAANVVESIAPNAPRKPSLVPLPDYKVASTHYAPVNNEPIKPPLVPLPNYKVVSTHYAPGNNEPRNSPLVPLPDYKVGLGSKHPTRNNFSLVNNVLTLQKLGACAQFVKKELSNFVVNAMGQAISKETTMDVSNTAKQYDNNSRVREEITLIRRNPEQEPEMRNVDFVDDEGSDMNADNQIIIGKRTADNRVICNYCNKVGHVKKYCRYRKKGLPPYYQRTATSSRNSNAPSPPVRERFRPLPYSRPQETYTPSTPDWPRPRYNTGPPPPRRRHHGYYDVSEDDFPPIRRFR